MPIKILLVDVHPLFRKGLRLIFEEEPDMSVVGEAGDGIEAIERAGNYRRMWLLWISPCRI